MAVDVYELIVPKGTTDVQKVANDCMNLIYSNLDANILTGLGEGIPAWVDTSDGTSIYSIHFSFGGADYCIIAFLTDNNSVSIVMNVQTVASKSKQNIISFSNVSFLTNSKTYKFLIGQDIDYFLFKEINNGFQYLTIKIDTPTNPNDTDVFITLLPYDWNSYNKPFNTEDITQINPSIISDAGSTNSLYNSTFEKNYYNNKIPLYNIYAHEGNYGVRGKISRLIMLPKSGMIEVGTFYSVNGIVYVGISKNYNRISGSLLLRC